MRVLRTITTPWTPYTLTFSRDGTRIAIGGGGWYGDGGIMIADLSTDHAELFRCAELQRDPDDFAPTVSGVCFSSDDRHLVASTRIPRKRSAPTLYFEVSGLTLTHKATLEREEEASWPSPTGVLLFGNHTIAHNPGAHAPEKLVSVQESPRELGIHADHGLQHLTNSNFVVVGSNAITAGRGLPVSGTYEDQWRTIVAFRESGRAVDEGLVSIALDGPLRSCQTIPVQRCRQITAVAATPDRDGFVTGGLEGELDHWSWDGRWRQERLREWTYDSKSVIAICYLAQGDRWLVVSSSGQVDSLAGSIFVSSWQLPQFAKPGSPRPLAAHPVQNWIAIALDDGQLGNERGVVALVDIESPGR
jgi:hypothetical protein